MTAQIYSPAFGFYIDDWTPEKADRLATVSRITDDALVRGERPDAGLLRERDNLRREFAHIQDIKRGGGHRA